MRLLTAAHICMHTAMLSLLFSSADIIKESYLRDRRSTNNHLSLLMRDHFCTKPNKLDIDAASMGKPATVIKHRTQSNSTR